MKIQITKRSISGATRLGLLTSLIAVAWVWYVPAEGERAFAAAGGDAVIVWNANAGVAATEACLAPLANPLHESRIYAMMHVAIHDALNAIDRRSRPYAFDAQAEAGASPDAAVAAAARGVLVPLIAQLPLELHTQACIDAGVASVDSKNHYNYWRPVTAIQTGDTDGNPDTVGDPTWTPLRPTPPNQDYASGHSIEGGAGAEVLKQFFGTDEVSFRDCSATLPAGSTCSDATPVFRSYTSFSQAAVENAHSRIFIGFHFRKSVEEGTEYGRKIGKRAANLYLRPVH